MQHRYSLIIALALAVSPIPIVVIWLAVIGRSSALVPLAMSAAIALCYISRYRKQQQLLASNKAVEPLNIIVICAVLIVVCISAITNVAGFPAISFDPRPIPLLVMVAAVARLLVLYKRHHVSSRS